MMDLEKKSIERIKLASEMSLQHYALPLVCTYSGGEGQRCDAGIIQAIRDPF